MTAPTPDPLPPPPPPVPSNAELLDLIDAQLVSLVCIAYFGPAERGTARSVEQVCAAEVLLFRLRRARDAVRELASAFGVESPVRWLRGADGVGPRSSAGGPAEPPVDAGKEPTPGSAVAVAAVACGSTGAVVAAGAGASSGRGGKGAVERASRPDSFSLPPQPLPPRFVEGEDRLVGAVYEPPVPSWLPRERRSAWRLAHRPIPLGEGAVYDALPKSP